jgi:ubiquinone/menaquinone biosynthesis C-methylase UbiE/DNA-directed RNA polymerase subunit E'/Rpb7
MATNESDERYINRSNYNRDSPDQRDDRDRDSRGRRYSPDNRDRSRSRSRSNESIDKPVKRRPMSIYIKNMLLKQVHLPLSSLGSNLNYILETIITKQISGKCIPEGYVKPNSIKILTYSSGNIIGNFIVFKVIFECLVCCPVEGMHINAIVKNITKAGVRCEILDNDSPLVIFIARDHHYKMPYFSKLKLNDKIKVRVIGQRFELEDSYISVIGELIEPYTEKIKRPTIILPEDEEDDEIVNEEEEKKYRSTKKLETPKSKSIYKEKEVTEIKERHFKNVYNKGKSTKAYITFVKTFKKGFQGYNVGRLPEKILDELNIIINKQNKTDNEIYHWLNNKMNKEVYSKYGINNNERGEYRANEINNLLQAINFTPAKLFDFGAGNVSITYSLSNILNLSKNDVYITDIKQPDNTYGFNFIKSDPDNYKINMLDNSADLITCLMVLHHVKDPEKTIEELYRILSPGGYLLIREHDNEDTNDYLVEALDMLHGFYEAVWNFPEKLENPDFPNKYYSNYKSNDEWSNMITRNGFTHINYPEIITNAYLSGGEDNNKRDINPYAFYYGIYKK